MTKAEWLLKCGWIVDDAAGVVIHVWSLPSWPMMAEGDTPGVEVDAAIRIQTAVIETECRAAWVATFNAAPSFFAGVGDWEDIGSESRIHDCAKHASDVIEAYRSRFIPPYFTDEAAK